MKMFVMAEVFNPELEGQLVGISDVSDDGTVNQMFGVVVNVLPRTIIVKRMSSSFDAEITYTYDDFKNGAFTMYLPRFIDVVAPHAKEDGGHA